MIPLVITELLHAVGASGSIIMLVMLATGLLHYRHALNAGRTIASASRTVAILVAVLVIGMTGLVPEFEVNVDFGTLGQFLGWLWNVLPMQGAIRWLF